MTRKRKTQENGYTLAYSEQERQKVKRTIPDYMDRLKHAADGGTAVVSTYAKRTPLTVQYCYRVLTPETEWTLALMGRKKVARWTLARTAVTVAVFDGRWGYEYSRDEPPPWRLTPDWQPGGLGDVVFTVNGVPESVPLLKQRMWVAPWAWDAPEPTALLHEALPAYAFADWCQEGGWPDAPPEWVRALAAAVA